MPTYDYVCDTCGETFEIFQSIKDERLTECPKPDCDGKIKRKISGGAGIIFKGSGFYQTDYRSESYNAGAKADKTASSTAAASSSGSSDSKSSSTPAPSTGSSSSTSSSSSSSDAK
jgi:putative FmdB family regulatory protein